VLETILTVIGTRPEAIKLAPVIKAIEAQDRRFTSRVVVTAQHRDMLDQVLSLWDVRPDHDLDLMRSGQSLGELTSRAMDGLSAVIAAERPSWVIVQGDTSTAMAGALSAFYQGVPVGHVEAGLRTYDMHHPFPEELNRRVVGLATRLHFAPTARAVDNLIREGVDPTRVVQTGNTVVDAFNAVARMPFDVAGSELSRLPRDKRIVMVTAHRRESFGMGIEEICAAVRWIATSYDDVHIAMPVHPNPKVSGPVYAALSGLANVTLLPPLDYRPMVWLMQRSHFLITDSGGLQEEATGVGKPVLILRDTTERPEGVEAGSARLVGAHRDRIIEGAKHLLDDAAAHRQMSRVSSPYGDGRASQRIVACLAEPDRVIDLTAPDLDSTAYDQVPGFSEAVGSSRGVR
jgi:UDP-N-acetylglucosamine 2-epimerase (non-hydrolysing)